MTNYSMVLIVNRSLKMSPGKVAVQVGHGAVSATLKALKIRPEILNNWINQGQRKICLKAISSEEMLGLEKKCTDKRVQFVEIRDAGKTEVPPNSLTVVALGPASDARLQKITGNFKLY